ncbi:MAG: diacylglycerol/polyprenol kinase family protein [Oscillospiraceae bacterium]
MKILLGYILTYGWVFLVLGLTQLIKAKTHAGDEVSRKIVHICVAFAWLPMVLCFGASWHLVLPPLTFVALNYVSARKNLFSAMERSDKAKQSYGTVWYAVSMSVMAAVSALYEPALPAYGVGLFCMALGDGFAPSLGAIQKGNRTLFRGRTLYGSIGVFVISLAVTAVMTLAFAMPLAPWQVLVIALGAAALELVSTSGLDNITLPLGVFALTLIFTQF